MKTCRFPVLSYAIVKEQFATLYRMAKNGDNRDRTGDLRLAKPALSQLSYIPGFHMVGLSGVEPLTSRLAGVRSNQLSYRPDMSALQRRDSLPMHKAMTT